MSLVGLNEAFFEKILRGFTGHTFSLSALKTILK